MLNFTNPGEIDIRAATVMGVNAKSGDSPIGFFGTGLKYAIASVLRLGGQITIHSGLTEYHFRTQCETIRGKEFNFIHIFHQPSGTWQPLGFTTDLGKAWEPWMVYRELWSNMTDEGGELLDFIPEPQADLTMLVIHCPELDLIASDTGDFLLSTAPIFAGENVEAHPGAGRIFYKGIRVGKTDKPAQFDYNIKRHLDLTEDRTIKYPWMLPGIVRDFLQNECQHPAVITASLTTPKDTFEREITFAYAFASETFKSTSAKIFREEGVHLHPSIYAELRKEERRNIARQGQLPAIQAKMLAKAKGFLKVHLQYHDTYPVYVQELGSSILGMAQGDEIFLDPRVFELGTKQVAVTLLEEYLHLSKGFRDESRQFQDWLLTRLVSMAEEHSGDPL